MSGTREICYRCQHSSGGCNGACRQPALSHWSLSRPHPKGCICPPASEKTCQRIDCGRKTAALAQADQGTGRNLADANSKKESTNP